MRSPSSLRTVVHAATLVGIIFAGSNSSAAGDTAAMLTEPRNDPAAACEQAVRETLASKGGRSADAVFTAAPTMQRNLSGPERLVLRGEGRWRAATGVRPFSYSCDLDRQGGDVVGVVLRDVAPEAIKVAAAPKPVEPDLSHLSPTACESSAALVLKKRWPQVTQISFDADARSYEQPTAILAQLHGRGRALPGQGKPVTLFGFDCEIDPRDGQVLGTRVSG